MRLRALQNGGVISSINFDKIKKATTIILLCIASVTSLFTISQRGGWRKTQFYYLSAIATPLRHRQYERRVEESGVISEAIGRTRVGEVGK